MVVVEVAVAVEECMMLACHAAILETGRVAPCSSGSLVDLNLGRVMAWV